MHRQTMLLYGVLIGLIGGIFLVIYLRTQASEKAPATVDHLTPALNKPKPFGETQPSLDASTFPPPATSGRPAHNPPPRRDEAISEADMTPFLQSDLASKWQQELGYTAAEIVAAQKEIRAQGYVEDLVNDSGMIMRHLPSRHVENLAIEAINIPAVNKADTPIRFTVSGTAPSPSYRFTHVDVLVQGPIIRIQVRGHADGETKSGQGGYLTVPGTIPPQPPGEYRIEVAELGPDGSFPFTISP